MTRYIPIIALLLMLGGCTSAQLASTGAAIGGVLGTYALDTFQADTRDMAAFNTKKNMQVDAMVDACRDFAKEAASWVEAKPIYLECLELAIANQPQIFGERVIDRVRRSRARRENRQPAEESPPAPIVLIPPQ